MTTEISLEVGTVAHDTEPDAKQNENESDVAQTGTVVATDNKSKHQVQESLLDFDTNVPKALKLSPVAEEETKDKGRCGGELDNYCNGVVRYRLTRWAFMSVLPVIYLIVLSLDDDTNLPRLVGIAIIIMYVVYFGLIAYLFSSGVGAKDANDPRYLFRIWTRSESVKGWTKMEIAAEQRRYQLHAIQSISEFSAVEGAVSSFMLANLGPTTWTMVTLHFAAELSYREGFKWDVADWLEMVGVSGLVMIGMFELDPYNKGMKLFHYIGAAAGVGTIAGFVIQSYSISQEKDDWWHMAGSATICVVAFTCFLLWQWANLKTDEKVNELHEKYTNATFSDERGTVLCCWKQRKLNDKLCQIDKPVSNEDWNDIRSTINRLSIRNVLFEGIFLFCGALSLGLWLISYHENCEYGCS